MDHGGEAARTTTTAVDSTDLGMAGAVQGGESNMSTGTFHGQLSAAAAPRAAAYAYHISAEFARHVRAAAGRDAVPVVVVFHREPVPVVVYANIIGAPWHQAGPLDTVFGPQLADGDVLVHDSSFYSALQPRPGAGRGGVLAALLPGGVDVVYDGDYALQRRQGAGQGQVHVNLLPDGAGHDEAFLGQLPGGGGAGYDDYGYYPWQPRAGAGRGEVFDGIGNFAQQALRDTRRADRIGGMARDLNIGAEYDDPGMAAERLRRLLAFAGIGTCSAAVNWLAAGPGSSPADAFHLFVLLLGGLFLVILHVRRM